MSTNKNQGNQSAGDGEVLKAAAEQAETLRLETEAAEKVVAEALAAEALAAPEAEAANAEAGEVKSLGEFALVRATIMDLRDPYVVGKTPEDSWLRVGADKEVELTNWLKSQIAAGYAEVVVV